ncbi:MAG: hypothetical protein H7A43_02585 [Verrucomicrobia bacterium]|nr:hypothetical protein [Verrucomicrobiota bacterium]
MKRGTLLLVAILLASCGQAPTFTVERLHENRQLFEVASGEIRIGRIEVKQEPHEAVFDLAVRRAKEGDPKGHGIRIIVPKQFKVRYRQELKNKPITCNLGPNLSMKQFVAEFPFEDWFLCPISKDTLAIVPTDIFK